MKIKYLLSSTKIRYLAESFEIPVSSSILKYINNCITYDVVDCCDQSDHYSHVTCSSGGGGGSHGKGCGHGCSGQHMVTLCQYTPTPSIHARWKKIGTLN